ncbi:RagB/SusD family nutrient uptake outer membrane protein [termite gut metagenome]|uniref:RagB/SusD family nutrient uptake outer membrane protein n=1 Tax=termite gut metagenome TaxID=433724 RepID=A0A5J4SYH3_9ZZZZ
MKILKKIIVLAVIAILTSCDDYIDVVPDNIPTMDNAFTMRIEAEKYLFTCYSYLPRHASVINCPVFFGGDELVPASDYASGLSPYYLPTGRQGLTTTYMNYWDGFNGGQLQRSGNDNDPTDRKGAYVAIRDCNIFLENIGKVPDLTEIERQRWIAEVQFLKAYYHFWLVKQYGPIIITETNIPIDANMDEAKPFRNTLDDCFEYIVNKLEEVIENEQLPDRITNEAQELGRVTKMIARALKAEVLITRASPLFNGNTYYVGLKDSRNIEIFNPVKTEDEKRQRWVDASEACLEAINFAHTLGYKLYYYTSPEYPNLSNDTKAKLNIRMAITDKWNEEILWGDANNWVGGGGNRDLAMQALPRGLNGDGNNTTQRNNHAVPIKIAEQFYTKNGVPITEDITWSYEDRYKLRVASSDEKYLLKEGYTTASLNFDREIRYYASLGFDGAIWFGQGKTDDNATCSVEAKFRQNCANQVFHSWNSTGIWPKKMVHFKTVVQTGTSGYTSVNYPFPIIRLSSLYLWYAEALNESGETNPDNIFEYVDLVRERASLKGVVESWKDYSIEKDKPTTLVGRRQIIQQERLIEFAFEGQRYWDLRRWMRAHIEVPKPLTGWNILEESATNYYSEKYIYTPIFRIKDYFTPITENEYRRNSNLVQNYGW